VNFLSQLLHEGKQHLQQHLTASVLGRKLFYMPFHRGIKATEQGLAAMAAALTYCKQVCVIMIHKILHKPEAYQASGCVPISCSYPGGKAVPGPRFWFARLSRLWEHSWQTLE